MGFTYVIEVHGSAEVLCLNQRIDEGNSCDHYVDKIKNSSVNRIYNKGHQDFMASIHFMNILN